MPSKFFIPVFRGYSQSILNFTVKTAPGEGNPRGVVANVLDCDIVANEVEFQSCCNGYFQTNTLGRGIEPPCPFSYG